MNFFGRDKKGEYVMHWELTCDKSDGTMAAKMRVSAYGAAILNLWVWPTQSEMEEGVADYQDLVLGWDNLNSYEKNDPFFGVVVGRVAGRINHGTFEVDGTTFNVTKVENKNFCLHGGLDSCAHIKWELLEYKRNYIKLEHFSPDKSNGFPGDLRLQVAYTLNYDEDKNSVEIITEYTGILTNHSCPINPTQHTYWNIGGHEFGAKQIKQQKVIIDANEILELNEDLLPTGEKTSLDGNVKDLREPKALEEGINAGGYDDYYIFANKLEEEDVLKDTTKPQFVCVDEKAARKLEGWSDQYGMQFYSANYLDDTTEPGKHKECYEKYGGICFETQGYPDAINHENFPTCIVKAGEAPYRQINRIKITNLN